MNKHQRIALAEKDLSVKKLGQVLDRHPVHVSAVLSGKTPSPDLRRAIADVLGKPEGHLWPESTVDQS